VPDHATRLAADPYITSDERAKVIRYLLDSQKEFPSCIEAVTDEQWIWTPAPDQWSVGETAHHIVLAEGLLFDMGQRALSSEPNPDRETKTLGKAELLERVIVDRSRKVRAPDGVNPAGKTMGRDRVVTTFTEVRTRTIQFAESTRLPLKQHTAAIPFPIFDPLNAYQLLLYVALHSLRHCQQIAEVKATPGYPG
jgi:hypothetical protein